jgi:branched-chain amino acid transport system substrate-binding protein
MTLGLRQASGAAIAALVFGGLIAGCTGGDNSSNAQTPTTGQTGATAPVANAGQTPIKIGLIASENGDLSPWGKDCVKGAQLALDDFNAAGGIPGHTVLLEIQDSGSKPEQGKSAAEKLIADNAVGLVGEVASGITAQIAIAAEAKNIPVVAVGATRTDLTAPPNTNIFRVCYTDDLQGPVMALFGYQELGLRKVGIVTDEKQPYSKGLSASFRKAFIALGGQIVDEQFYESGQSQFGGQVTALKAKNPDGLFMSGYFTEVGQIARQAHDAGLSVPMLGGDGWDSAQIVQYGGDAILGSYFCNHYNNKESRPEVQDFLVKWKSKYPDEPEPGTTMGALGYDATMVTLDALKNDPGLDSKGLAVAIENTVDFPGVTGKITLKGMHGNPPKRALVVKLTKDGQEFAKAYEAADVQKALAAAGKK